MIQLITITEGPRDDGKVRYRCEHCPHVTAWLRQGIVVQHPCPNEPRAAPVVNIKPKTPNIPCRHFGEQIGLELCEPCCGNGGNVRIRIYACAIHGKCTAAKTKLNYPGCQCSRYEPISSVPLTIGRPIRFSQNNLWHGVHGMRFNCSLMSHEGDYLFVARNGWKGSDIFVGRMDQSFQPVGDARKLELRAHAANYGREDPRLFMHKGQPHLSFIGVEGGHRILRTNQMFASLSPDGMSVEDVFHPHFPGRNSWEKNWTFFDWEDDLYAVYSISPHRIVLVKGNHAEMIYETPFPAKWNGGELRGGTAPVRIGDEFFSFFHDRIEPHGRRLYRAGVYTFEARPPFRILRFCEEPLLVANALVDNGQHDNYCDVVFPGGAVLADRKWFVASGEHDRRCRIDAFSAAEIDRCMKVFAKPTPSLTGDFIVAALNIKGQDYHNSGKKVRQHECGVAALTLDELSEYIKPFLWSSERWNIPAAIIHDGVAQEFIDRHSNERVQFYLSIPTEGDGNYERRWFAWRNWLAANQEIRIAWMVDINDIGFRSDPRGALSRFEPGQVFVATEDRSYRDNPWFMDHLPHLPQEYTDLLIGQHGDRLPLCAGAWAADGKTALEVCRATCRRLLPMKGHLERNGMLHKVVCDMMAFGAVMLKDFAAERIKTFPLGGDFIAHGPNWLSACEIDRVASRVD